MGWLSLCYGQWTEGEGGNFYYQVSITLLRVDEYLNNDGFSCIIVYGLHQQRKYNETLAEERIKESLTTWITENDFQGIQALGFNSVRLPVGYWNVMDDPYKLFVPKNYHESLYYIDWCFDMADR